MSNWTILHWTILQWRQQILDRCRREYEDGVRRHNESIGEGVRFDGQLWHTFRYQGNRSLIFFATFDERFQRLRRGDRIRGLFPNERDGGRLRVMYLEVLKDPYPKRHDELTEDDVYRAGYKMVGNGGLASVWAAQDRMSTDWPSWDGRVWYLPVRPLLEENFPEIYQRQDNGKASPARQEQDMSEGKLSPERAERLKRQIREMDQIIDRLDQAMADAQERAGESQKQDSPEETADAVQTEDASPSTGQAETLADEGGQAEGDEVRRARILAQLEEIRQMMGEARQTYDEAKRLKAATKQSTARAQRETEEAAGEEEPLIAKANAIIDRLKRRKAGGRRAPRPLDQPIARKDDRR